MSDRGHLLIIGAPKAASTSVYRYLADHPDVCSSAVKETYFFARDFDDKGVCRVGTTRADFETYFPGASDRQQLRLEATPYTMYSEGAARTIEGTLPATQLLVVMRDPVDRLVSEYRYRIQRGQLTEAETSFANYVQQLEDSPKDRSNPLIVGCYATFLREYVQVFGRDRLAVGFQEDLVADPAHEMWRLATQFGLDADWYRDYSFEVHNRTVGARFGWLGGLRVWLEPRVSRIRHRLAGNERSSAVADRIAQIGGKTIDRLNAGPTPRATIDEVTRSWLQSYYQPHDSELVSLLGCDVPWASKANVSPDRDDERGGDK